MSKKSGVLWYVSLHGGGGKKDWNNVHAFTVLGKKARPFKVLDKGSLTQNVDLRELRGMSIGPDGHLYVTNAYCPFSQILRFDGALNAKGRHEFIETYTQYQWLSNPGLVHPFQAIFGPDGNLYVASQDTCAVTRYYGPKEATRGAPMPPAAALAGCDPCYPGAFVPSRAQHAHGITSVRGIAFGPDRNLYVADEDANLVNVYDGATGRLLKTLIDESVYPDLDKPDHLLFWGSVLYIGNSGKNTVLSMDTYEAAPPVIVYVDNESGEIDGPAGMCFGSDGRDTLFYLASRKNNRILCFKPRGATARYRGRLVKNLGDHPEFIKQVDFRRVRATRPSTPSLLSDALCGS